MGKEKTKEKEYQFKNLKFLARFKLIIELAKNSVQ